MVFLMRRWRLNSGYNGATDQRRTKAGTIPALKHYMERNLGEFSYSVVWTPAQITTALWLDADDASTITLNGSNVSAWNDKSGNGRHATQTGTAQPLYSSTGLNNKPALDFDGADDDLVLSSVSDVNSVSQSWFIVAKRDNASGRTEISFGIGNKQESNGLADIPRWTDNKMYSQMGYVANRPSPVSVISDAPYINCVTGGAVQLSYTNGTLIGTGTTQSLSNFSVLDGGYVGSGRAMSFFGRYFDGKISELIIVPSVATTQDRQLIEGYLAHKWGLTSNLPVDHPYKSVVP
jgi:hypothetical protein